jgi:hypothetical protein
VKPPRPVGLDNASTGKDRWIAGYGTNLRGLPVVDRKTVATEATRPRRGRYTVCRNHREAEKDGADRAQLPSVSTRGR